MFSKLRVLIVFSLLSVFAAAFPPSYGGHNKASVGKAVYVNGNEAENSVYSLRVKSDGTLYGGSKTPTGGKGSNIAKAGDASDPQAPDALGSQGAVAVAGNYVFAVNAGSNSLSMFEARRDDASQLKLLGKPAQLPGQFPTTVGVSEKHRIACVGFSGAKSGVSCVPYTSRGLGHADTLRPFQLGQTTPPNSSLDLVSSTFFSGDENYVYTTVRGSTGFFSSFPVEGYGRVGTKDTRSLVGFNGTLFGAVSVPGTNEVWVSDPSIGADEVTVNGYNQQATVKVVDIPGQKASCWLNVSPKTNSLYVSDAGVDRLVELDLDDGSIIKIQDFSNGDPGLFDLDIAGNYVYLLYAGNGTIDASITVVDTKGKQGYMKQVQHYSMAHLGVTPNAAGLATMK